MLLSGVALTKQCDAIVSLCLLTWEHLVIFRINTLVYGLAGILKTFRQLDFAPSIYHMGKVS